MIQEYHFGTIYGVRLNIRTVNELLQIAEPNHVVINIASNLEKRMGAVRRNAVRANAEATVQAEHVHLVLPPRLVEPTGGEEGLRD